MDAYDLARLEHENMVESIALASANATGALIRRVAGVALILSGLPIRLFNQVIVERDDAARDAVADAVATARARGDHFMVNLRAQTDDALTPLMGELGLVSLPERTPGMALYPIPADDPNASRAGHAIVRVTDEQGVEDHIRSAVAGFEMPESVLRGVVGAATLEQPGVALYVGYTDDEPVSTGLGVRTGRTIGVYNISTIPAARRRGYGAAMSRRVASDGAAAGCDVAVLQSSEMGYPVYERIGYRTVVEYVGYVDPAPLPASDLESGPS
jgi:GNAT superfamily N-acetyltransferase